MSSTAISSSGTSSSALPPYHSRGYRRDARKTLQERMVTSAPKGRRKTIGAHHRLLPSLRGLLLCCAIQGRCPCLYSVVPSGLLGGGDAGITAVFTRDIGKFCTEALYTVCRGFVHCVQRLLYRVYIGSVHFLQSFAFYNLFFSALPAPVPRYFDGVTLKR